MRKPMHCQATPHEPATVRIDTDIDGFPIWLSEAAAERLRALSLRPGEWFNLARIHGPCQYWLHEDFYTSLGEAVQPQRPVLNAESFPVPEPSDVETAIDLWIVWEGRSPRGIKPIDLALREYPPRLVMESVKQRLSVPTTPWVRMQLYALASHFAADIGADWVRMQWCASDSREYLWYLVRLSLNALTRKELLAKVWTAVDAMAPAERKFAENAVALATESLDRVDRWRERIRFLDMLAPDHKGHMSLIMLADEEPTLISDWLERTNLEPVVYHWGKLAAVVGVPWSRLEDWLSKGRPLSLVALDALRTHARTDEKYELPTVLKNHRLDLPGKPRRRVAQRCLEASKLYDEVPRIDTGVRNIPRRWRRIRKG